MKTYTAHVTREGKWWMVNVPAIDDFTQARRLSEAGRMAAELVALATDVDIDDVTIDLKYAAVGPVDAIDERLRALINERRAAVLAEARAAEYARQLARELVEAEVPLRDVGTMLGVSHQRVHQLVS